jgi:hypothetical protein
MKSPIFIFAGLNNNGSSGDLEAMKDRLHRRLLHLPLILNIDISGNQLILALTNPDFRFYISLIKQKQLKAFRMLARDFDLPWDGKEINMQRLSIIFNIIEKESWYPFKLYHEVGFAILDELENLENVSPYSIPSMDK